MQFSFETLSFILTYWVGVFSFPLLCNTVCPGQRKPLLGIEVQELETRLDSPVKAFYLITSLLVIISPELWSILASSTWQADRFVR